MAKIDVKALREKVFSNDDIQYDEVYVEEWDVTLPIRTISAADLKTVMKYHNDPVRMAILAVIYGCKTKEGEAVFEEKDLAKFENEKSFGAIQKVSEKILEISGFGEDQVKEAKKD
ncbi:hypothetical protein ACTHHL_04305 [Aeribacillus composti]|uniref:hypothetical protein n=1 Tax=Aeribacillus composti TaxID=1868734 RepID=UPI00406A8ACA